MRLAARGANRRAQHLFIRGGVGTVENCASTGDASTLTSAHGERASARKKWRYGCASASEGGAGPHTYPSRSTTASSSRDNPCMPISTLCRPRSGDAPRMLRPRGGPRPSAGATAPSRAHSVEYWRPPRTQITPAACQIASSAGFSLFVTKGEKGCLLDLRTAGPKNQHLSGPFPHATNVKQHTYV